MKKLMLLIAMLVSVLASEAQTTYYKVAPNVYRGQMLRTSSTYAGTYIDTVTASTTRYLYIDSGTNGYLTPRPLMTYGTLEITLTETKISGGPYGGATLESSPDNVTWGTEAYNYTTTVYADTMLIDSASATKTKTWKIKNPTNLFYRVKLGTNSNTQSSSYICKWILKPDDNY